MVLIRLFRILENLTSKICWIIHCWTGSLKSHWIFCALQEAFRVADFCVHLENLALQARACTVLVQFCFLPTDSIIIADDCRKECWRKRVPTNKSCWTVFSELLLLNIIACAPYASCNPESEWQTEQSAGALTFQDAVCYFCPNTSFSIAPGKPCVSSSFEIVLRCSVWKSAVIMHQWCWINKLAILQVKYIRQLQHQYVSAILLFVLN